jgi:hypothetical protein
MALTSLDRHAVALTSLAADSYNPAMKEDTKVTQRDIDEALVRLKPILGIKPSHYLAALFGAILVTLAFLLLVFPGIRNNGRVFSFQVDPPNSAVYIDGVYRGHSPCPVFVPGGDRALLVTRPGFKAHEAALVSRGRLFGTLFVPSRTSLSLELVPTDGNSILTDGMARYASWALAGTPSEAYQIPMELSEAATAATIHPGMTVPAGFAGTALSYTRHSQSLRDASRAIATVYGKSAAVGPITLGRLAGALLSEISSDPAALAAFASSASDQVRKKLEQNGYYKNLMSEQGRRESLAGRPYSGSPLSFRGVDFVGFGPGTAVIKTDAALSAVVELDAFHISSTETSTADFRRFIAGNPGWAKSERAELEKQGLGDAEFLKDIETADGDQPIRYVSKPAAEAYCAWLSKTAPPGYKVTLPTEAQWSYAASASGSSASASAVLRKAGAGGPALIEDLPPDAAGMRGLLGNVWEWCSDPYATHPASGIAGRESYPSLEFVVRGGSWANRADLVGLDSRGPMPASTCSAYLGFRIVLVPVSD